MHTPASCACQPACLCSGRPPPAAACLAGAQASGRPHTQPRPPAFGPQVALEAECRWRRIDKPGYFDRWVDLKGAFRLRYKRSDILRRCVESVGLQWQGRAHSGLDDALNTARLAAHMIRDGWVLKVSGSFEPADAAAPAGGPGAAQQTTLVPLRPPKLFDAQGHWSGLCRCGARAQRRVTRQPGANHGRAFFSCGRWSVTHKGGCDFMLWADEVKGGVGAAAGAAAGGAA